MPPEKRVWKIGAPAIEYVPKRRGAKRRGTFECAGSPELIKETVEAIYQVKAPLILDRDGIHWSDASAELIEFAEYARVPVVGRRSGRGAIPDTHPLASISRGFSALKNDIDLRILIGMKVGFFDGYGKG